MTKTPLFPSMLFVPILIFLFISGCGHSSSTSTNQPPTLISIAVSPAARSIPLDMTRSFGVTGTYSDGSQKGISAGSVTWSSTNTGVMSINAAGLATPKSQGTTTISAAAGGITVSLDLTVTPKNIFTNWSTTVNPADPVGVAVDSSGNIYVADAAPSNNMVHRYNSQRIQTLSWTTSITSNVLGVAVDTSGNVYETDYGNNQLLIYNSAGALTAIWSTTAPAGVAVDSSGNVYVTDAKNNYLYKYNSSHVLTASWSTTGVPSGVAVDSSGNVYVADFSELLIRKYSSAGTQTAFWSTTGTPFGVAVDPSGTKVYVVDTFYYLLREYDATGVQQASWSTIGWPNAVAVDSSGNVYVVDATNNRVREMPASANSN